MLPYLSVLSLLTLASPTNTSWPAEVQTQSAAELGLVTQCQTQLGSQSLHPLLGHPQSGCLHL